MPTQGICSDCGQFRKIAARLRCNVCYQRAYSQGHFNKDIDKQKRIRAAAKQKPYKPAAPPKQFSIYPDDVRRFWSKVRFTDSCWEWIGGQDSDGYGRFTVERENCKAHRVAYGLIRGEIATDLELDHTCRNRACVNPAHLEPVTHLENLRRGHERRRADDIDAAD